MKDNRFRYWGKSTLPWALALGFVSVMLNTACSRPQAFSAKLIQQRSPAAANLNDEKIRWYFSSGSSSVTWTRCANEDQTCSFSGTRQVRYGVGGVYFYRTATSSIGCNNLVFGDPVVGQDKYCDYSSVVQSAPAPSPSPTPAPAPSWVSCAVEGGVCSFSGTRDVRYGLNGTYSTKSATGSIECSNSVFGDPLPGVDKVCEYSSETTVSPSPAPTSSPSPAPAPNPTSFQLGMRPFASTSSWNKPVASTAKYTQLNWPASTGYNYWVNWDNYSPAVYMSNSADPLVEVSIPANWGWPASTISLHLKSGVTGAAGTDGEILIIDGTTVHNFWQFNRTSDTTATASAYGRTDVLTGSGWGSSSPFLSAGIVAAGSSQFAGLLVKAEADNGEIEHALQLAVDYAINHTGSVGEAISGDGTNPNGISTEGERLALPANMSMPSGLSPLGQKVFRALKKYGCYNIDQAGGVTTIRAQSNSFDDATISALRTDMNKLLPYLQRVDNY